MTALTLAPADDAAIRALVQRLMDGWNAGDADAFAAPFTDDADYVIFSGRHITGRNGIRAGHEWLFSGPYRGSHNDYVVEQVRLLRPGVAVAHARAHLVYTTAEGEQVGHARFSLVLLQADDGAWQAAAFQNTPIQDG